MRIHKAQIDEFEWKNNRLYYQGVYTGASVVPDNNWKGMWRVKLDGALSDMVNITRAKDAAIGLVRAAARPPAIVQ